MTSPVRPEETCDRGAIDDLTERAFAPMPVAAGDEQDLISVLRDAGALSLSLVAEQNGEMIGHIALAPGAHESGDGDWFVLGPISVEPALQKMGSVAA